MEVKSLQETYEYIRNFFLAQGVLAKTDDSCDYRNESGEKCAVGCLIPDELYDSPLQEIWHPFPNIKSGSWDIPAGTKLGSAIEGKGVETIIRADPRLKELLNGDTPEGQERLSFLRQAQSAHDDEAGSVSEFIEQLDFLAEEFGLKPVS